MIHFHLIIFCNDNVLSFSFNTWIVLTILPSTESDEAYLSIIACFNAGVLLTDEVTFIFSIFKSLALIILIFLTFLTFTGNNKELKVQAQRMKQRNPCCTSGIRDNQHFLCLLNLGVCSALYFCDFVKFKFYKSGK